MNICMVIGSKYKESSTKKVLEHITKNALIQKDNLKIHRHFLSEYSLENDYKKYVKKIKRDLISSDVIFFASPVYVNNISGYMKFLIEELSLWTHLMPLAGKKGISIAVSSRGSNNFAEEYLKYVLSYMGVDVVCSYGISPKNMHLIPDISKEIYEKISQTSHRTNELLEILFSNWKKELTIAKKSISENPEIPTPEEVLYWDRNDLWQYSSFKELIEDIDKGKKLYLGEEY